MKKLVTFFWLYLCLTAHAQTIKTEKWSIPGTTRYYWGMTYLPQGYSGSGASFPLIVFLHGLGEGFGHAGQGDSTNVDSILYRTGLPKYLKTGHNIPFLALAPQTKQGDIGGLELSKIINLFKAKYNVDLNRVYLTGLSMGGRSIVRYFLENTTGYADSVIAAAPLSVHHNASDSSWLPNSFRWKGKDIWIACGTSDNASPYFRYTYCIRYIDSINSNGGKGLLTPVAGVGHSSQLWDSVYYKVIKYNGTTDIYSWLLQHSLGPKRILIDIGNPSYPTDSIPNIQWNNITNGSAGTWLSSVVDTTGATVNLSISVDKKPGGTYANDNSINSNGYTSAIGEYPASAVRDNVYFHTSSGITGITFSIPAGKKADITFFGTREGAAPRILQLRKAGDTAWKEYEGAYNHTFTNNVQFTGCTGLQVIEARVKSGSIFGYISVIDIRLGNSSSSLRVMLPPPPAPALSRVSPEPAANTINLYNNPAKYNVILQMSTPETGKLAARLYNARGQLIKTFYFEKSQNYFQQPITVAGLPKGLYYLQINIGRTSTTKKFIVLQ